MNIPSGIAYRIFREKYERTGYYVTKNPPAARSVSVATRNKTPVPLLPCPVPKKIPDAEASAIRVPQWQDAPSTVSAGETLEWRAPAGEGRRTGAANEQHTQRGEGGGTVQY